MQLKKQLNVKTLLMILLLVAAIILPQIGNRRVLNIMIVVLMYITLGESWNVLSGLAGMFSVTHAIYFGVGVYGVSICCGKFGLPLIVGILVGLVGNVLLALIVGTIGSKLSGLYYAMALIGVQQTLYTLATQLVDITGGAYGLPMPVRLLLPKKTLCYIILGLAVLYMIIFTVIRRSRMGTHLVALKSNPDLSSALGSNNFNWRLIAVIISACMASLSGVFYAFHMMSNNQEVFASAISLKIMMIVLVGGSGNVWGPVLGSTMIVLDEILRGAISANYASISVIVYAVVLIVVLNFRPDGLITLNLKGLFTKKKAAPLKEPSGDSEGR